MKLYNTPHRAVEDFKPQDPNDVKIYTCGPTVYDYQHIGNWFTYIRYDLLVRTLTANGYHLNWVLNITDVGHLVSDADEGEDKLEKGARREHKSAREVADFYSSDFSQGLSKLNITKPNLIPKATDTIPEQINLIERLEALDFTYIIDDGVYYDTSKFSAYADFGHLDLDNLQASGRFAPNLQKKNVSDFALWKFSPKNEKRDMEWDSPWGVGFPGWHLECSAMIMKYLGETIDIHAGGIDHIPVHHTNEIAQSQAATNKPLANYWVHTNHILIDEDKISKSLGNGITLQDIAAKNIDLRAVRLLALESHYRTQSKFGWDELQAANNRLKAYRSMSVLRWQAVKDSDDNGQIDFNGALNQLKQALFDDLNSPLALSLLSGLEKQLSTSLVSLSSTDEFSKFLIEIDKLLGLQLADEPDITAEQKLMITKRAQARANLDWAKADEIKDKLLELGIAVRDTFAGPIWSRA